MMMMKMLQQLEGVPFSDCHHLAVAGIDFVAVVVRETKKNVIRDRQPMSMICTSKDDDSLPRNCCGFVF
jgi:hypothetical protein